MKSSRDLDDYLIAAVIRNLKNVQVCFKLVFSVYLYRQILIILL